MVLAYTDGLFERKRHDVDYALEAMRTAAHMAFMASASVDELANTVINLGLSDTNDDACLVVLAV